MILWCGVGTSCKQIKPPTSVQIAFKEYNNNNKGNNNKSSKKEEGNNNRALAYDKKAFKDLSLRNHYIVCYEKYQTSSVL